MPEEERRKFREKMTALASRVIASAFAQADAAAGQDEDDDSDAGQCEERGCVKSCVNSIAYGALSMGFCQKHYDSNWAKHPENPANADEG